MRRLLPWLRPTGRYGCRGSYPDKDRIVKKRRQQRLAAEATTAILTFLAAFHDLEKLGSWVHQVDVGGRRWLVPSDPSDRMAFDHQGTKVNLVAPAAAKALDIAGALLAYSPAGSLGYVPMNPVAGWTGLLQPQPMFTRDQLVDACQTAIGSLSPEAQRLDQLAQPRSWPGLAGLGRAALGAWKWIAGIAAGVAVPVLVLYFTNRWFGAPLP